MVRFALVAALAALVSCGALPPAPRAAPPAPPPEPELVAPTLVAASSLTCALDDGAVVCWGGGDVDARQRFVESMPPTRMSGFSDVRRVALGGDPNGEALCAIDAAGAVLCRRMRACDPVDPEVGCRLTATDPAADFEVELGGPLPADAELIVTRRAICARAGTEARCWNDDAVRTLDEPARALAPSVPGAEPCRLEPDGRIACGEAEIGRYPNERAALRTHATFSTQLIVCAFAPATEAACWFALAGQEAPDVDVTPLPMPPLGPLRQLTVDHLRACAVTQERRAVCWDTAPWTRPAHGEPPGRPEPEAVAGGVSELAMSGHHLCVRREGGGVACRGLGRGGELGRPWPEGRAAPAPVEGAPPSRQLVADASAVCSVAAEDGRVHCWGAGRGVSRVADWTGARDVSVRTSVALVRSSPPRAYSNGSSVCAIVGDRVVCRAGDRTTYDGSHPGAERFVTASCVRAGDAVTCQRPEEAAFLAGASLAARSRHSTFGVFDGRVRSDRDEAAAAALAELDSVEAISVGSMTVCALDAEAGLVCTDGVDSVRLETLPDGVENLSVGYDGGVCLRADGRAHCQLDREPDAPIELAPVEGVDDLAQVVVGWGFACGRREDGEVLCWGSNLDAGLGESLWTDDLVDVPWPE